MKKNIIAYFPANRQEYYVSMAMQTPFWSYRECESTQRGRKRGVSITSKR